MRLVRVRLVTTDVVRLADFNRSVVIHSESDDVAAEHRRMAQVLADVVLEPVTQPCGNRTVTFHDPDGNRPKLFSRRDVQ